MAKEEQEFQSRRMRRYSDKKRKMNRILNILIAVVFALIVINVYFIVKDDEDYEVAEKNEPAEKIEETVEEQKEQEESVKEPVENKDPDDVIEDEASLKKGKEDEIIVSSSPDPNVEKVIVNNNWQVTPTRQTGEHVSAFQEGHIDYEEKLITIRNAVELPEDDIIYWSVRNDGTGKGSISVVSSKDLSKKYRVHIKWIDNAGWIPIKVEVLKQIEEMN